jgi:antitoxin YefM
MLIYRLPFIKVNHVGDDRDRSTKHEARSTKHEARSSLLGLIQLDNADHAFVEVASRHGNAVIVSKDDYDGMTETAYRLRSPANADRSLTAIDRARRGEFEHHDFPDA